MFILDTILNILFPVNCLSCGKNEQPLCPDCLLLFPLTERETPNWIFPIFDYQDLKIKKSIWFLKYQGKKSLAKVFAEILYPRILEELSELKVLKNFGDPILIPIPLSPKGQRERGFNQAELLCRELINLDKNKNFISKKNVLIKSKETAHQAKIHDRKKRLENIIGTFTVKNSEKIKNRNIVLIDDVTTTGATLTEAKKTLKKAGAKKIIAFTIAH